MVKYPSFNLSSCKVLPRDPTSLPPTCSQLFSFSKCFLKTHIQYHSSSINLCSILNYTQSVSHSLSYFTDVPFLTHNSTKQLSLNYYSLLLDMVLIQFVGSYKKKKNSKCCLFIFKNFLCDLLQSFLILLCLHLPIAYQFFVFLLLSFQYFHAYYMSKKQ